MEQRTLAGRYELAEPLGEATWRAVDTELGREVLVRFRPPGPAAALSHPNVRRVFDHGTEEGEPYEVLEYLPGGTLAERGRLAPRDAEALAAALAYAHAQGLTHGAIAADAVLFDAEGNAKLAGFTGAGDPEADVRALDELTGAYVTAEAEQTLVVPPPAEEATVIRSAPVPRPRRGRRGALLAAVAAALLLAGLGAAYLATSDDAAPAPTTGTLSVPVPGTTAATDTPTTEAPPTTTEAEETTTAAATTVATTETQPTTPTATIAPPPPTRPEPPPTTTEVPPPLPPTEPPTTEPPPPTTAPEEPPPTETGG